MPRERFYPRFPLAICALHCMLLRCGSASRYRRPPWAFPPLTWAAFCRKRPFCAAIVNQRLFGCRAVGPQLLDRDRRERFREHLKVCGQPAEGGRAFETPLVHVKRAVELELNGMQAGSRI